MKTSAWDRTIANLGSRVGQSFRSGAYRLLAIDADGLDVIAGSAYRAAFEALQVFGSSPVSWECPVAGLQIGELRCWLSTQT